MSGGKRRLLSLRFEDHEGRIRAWNPRIQNVGRGFGIRSATRVNIFCPSVEIKPVPCQSRSNFESFISPIELVFARREGGYPDRPECATHRSAIVKGQLVQSMRIPHHYMRGVDFDAERL